MALNPIAYTENIVRSFLRYQFTTHALADEQLREQMRSLLSLSETRASPLLKGPYLSLSRSFRKGASITTLIDEGLLHPIMRERIPANIQSVYGHQEEALRAIAKHRNTLIATGTGSGKTECFLYPIISHCLRLKEQHTPAGIRAIIVYPMNSLAEDQLGRLRSLLAGTGIPFGMYVGHTPEKEADVSGVRLPEGSSRADYQAQLEKSRRERPGETVHPAEERCSREAMRTAGQTPRILLSNIKQLELLLTRRQDIELFADVCLDYLVFDEAHTLLGARGAEAACLVRRMRHFCGSNSAKTLCIATSATISTQDDPDAARKFISRFFGIQADTVSPIHEHYDPEQWAQQRALPAPTQGDPAGVLEQCVQAVIDAEDSNDAVETEKILGNAYRQLCGQELPQSASEGPSALHCALSANELLFQLSEILKSPHSLQDLPAMLKECTGLPTSPEELLAWLSLGAATQHEGRPFLRPVVHGFIRGIDGAVVYFPSDNNKPQLCLAAEDQVADSEAGTAYANFPLTACTTCGQHYFLSFLKDFEFTGKKPSRGAAMEDGGAWWEALDKALGGCRVVLSDGIIGDADDEDSEPHAKMAQVYFCRYCRSAHSRAVARCQHCGTPRAMVPLFAIQQNEKHLGLLSSCLLCSANMRRVAGRDWEPARAVRASTVADVHVLAQDMVHHAERKRLLTFCDNRQDAAFQAGWMKDRARRFRMRGLMQDALQKKTCYSVGDLTHHLDDLFENDTTLSRALAPEVWRVARREDSGQKHRQERRRYLRIQVLRELVISARQPLGLEPWGLMKVDYNGLSIDNPWLQSQARALKLPAEAFHGGIQALLDNLRHNRILYDPELELFTRYFQSGDVLIQNGYIPLYGGPKGTKFQRNSHDKVSYAHQWYAKKGRSTLQEIARKWGVSDDGDAVRDFLRELFDFLKELDILHPTVLKGSKGRALPGTSGLYQINADLLTLHQHHGVQRCHKCRRRTVRHTPHQRCLTRYCKGTLKFVPEDDDDYNLQLLRQAYTLLRPAGHTAMVPATERERLENFFKGSSDVVNCFVCTPTLELGVDIGAVDTTLMRNVPPLASNYWQRTGRAGRRHRMAVNITYCGGNSHDRAYYKDPLKLLKGRIEPPAFNLSNELMVAKHVHATILSRLYQYTQNPTLTQESPESILATLQDCFPKRISHYLFLDGIIRKARFSLQELSKLISNNCDDLMDYVQACFQGDWPSPDKKVVESEALKRHIAQFSKRLDEVLDRLRGRLYWAREQMERLDKRRRELGVLEGGDEQLYRRCERLVARLKGRTRRRSEAEGHDDINTFSVLAAEGFLPGHGLEIGSVRANAEIPFWLHHSGSRDFSLPRVPATALREYVPGNLIYANDHRFATRHFHFATTEKSSSMPRFEVDTERQAVRELEGVGSAMSALPILPAITVCDVDLAHESQISDEEDLRFQMGVAIYGIEQERHDGGREWRWGEQALHHLKGVHLRLVNVGASVAIDRGQELGYPVCTVCGQSRSPLSSDLEKTKFEESHTERCSKKPHPIAFYTDIVADVIALPDCNSREVAYSVLEALRKGAAHIVDMDIEDLQILVIGHIDRDEVKALLWDPMPGGSGLIDQVLAHFPEIIAESMSLVQHCAAVCDSACIDCLHSFRNRHYHKYLWRKRAEEQLQLWGGKLKPGHDIPAEKQSAPNTDPNNIPVNEAERRLRQLLLAAGFGEAVRGEQLHLDRAIGSTTPDVIYRAAHHSSDEGVCIYLDGMSRHLHGNAETAKKDQRIRTWLRNNSYEVLEITVTELHDRNAMTAHFIRLGHLLQQQPTQDWYLD